MNTSYRWPLFKDWRNVSYLGAIGIAGAIFGWPVLVFGLAAEAAALWVLPDMGPIKRALEHDARIDRVEKERIYYVEKLFGVSPPPMGFKEFFIDSRINWANLLRPLVEDSVSFWAVRERLSVLEGGDTHEGRVHIQKEALTFLRLIRICSDLRKLAEVKPETVTPAHIARIEQGINQYLMLTYMARSADHRLSRFDRDDLLQQFKAAKELPSTSRQARIVRAERIKLLKQRVEELPSLEHRAGLARAQADAAVMAIEAFLDQARSAGTGSSLALDGLVDPYSLNEEYFDQVAINQEVYGGSVDENFDLAAIEKGLGLEPASEQVEIPLPHEEVVEQYEEMVEHP